MRRAALSTLAVSAAAMACAQMAVPGLSISSQPSRIVLNGSSVAAVPRSRRVSMVDPNEQISATLALRPRDMAGLQAAADSVSDPKSANYRNFLTPEQIGDRYGASATDRQAVVDFLASKGLTVTLSAPNGLAVLAQGTAVQWQNAFGTQLANFEGPDPSGTQTVTYRANTSELTLPASVASVVTYVSGLETNTRPMRRTTSTLSPGQGSGLYNLTTGQGFGYYGVGRHVAISNFDGFRLSNATAYSNYFGLPRPGAGYGTNVAIVEVGALSFSNTTGHFEGDLDLQMVLAQSPLADIRVYDSRPQDLIATLSREATDNWADVITESYGWNGGTTDPNAFYASAHTIHVAMTAQGITYLCASGDTGTSVSSFPYPDFDPEVLMVGGTIGTVNSNLFDLTGTRVSEEGWNGSGGGWYNQPTTGTPITWNVLPSWQKGNGVPTTINRRLYPDVGFHAAAANSNDAGAQLVVFTPNRGSAGFYGVSGTSAAAPMLAGMLTSVEGRLYTSYAGSTRPRLGRLQNLIYSQNGRSDVYHDILSGTIGSLPNSVGDGNNVYSGPTASGGVGWDFVTGWGSMDMEAFYRSFIGGRRP